VRVAINQCTPIEESESGEVGCECNSGMDDVISPLNNNKPNIIVPWMFPCIGYYHVKSLS
jgi:hypothetical protein